MIVSEITLESSSMEDDILMQRFVKSEKEYSVIDNKLIADDYSSTLKKI